MALVLGFISADNDISQVGTDVKDRFADTRESRSAARRSPSTSSHTTQDDLKRIELYALPLLLLLSFLIFRGLVAALLPVAVGSAVDPHALLLLNALTTVVDIDTSRSTSSPAWVLGWRSTTACSW